MVSRLVIARGALHDRDYDHTIGYGDYSPFTPEGRLCAVFFVLVVAIIQRGGEYINLPSLDTLLEPDDWGAVLLSLRYAVRIFREC